MKVTYRQNTRDSQFKPGWAVLNRNGEVVAIAVHEGSANVIAEAFRAEYGMDYSTAEIVDSV